ncbi:unnamed protein product [Alopecurus aequalis]
MELRNAASISAEALLLSMHKAYSITEASHGRVILLRSVPAKLNSSWDIRKSSLKTVVPRSTSGTSNRMPSVVYTMQWPLIATDEHDALHDPLISSADVDDNQKWEKLFCKLEIRMPLSVDEVVMFGGRLALDL